ncbi:MAG: LPS assembly lipoprotein LptE [Pseudomonadota bacterium]
MSSFSRRTVMLAPLAIAACGYTPVYGTGGTGTVLQNNVIVVEPRNENTYLVTKRIEERLGRSQAATYVLTLNVVTSRQALAVNSESNINRFNLVGVARYSLVEQASGRVVTSGQVNNFTGSSASGTTAETLAATRDAQRRLMTLLADQVVVKLLSADVT